MPPPPSHSRESRQSGNVKSIEDKYKKTPPPHWKRREVTMFTCQICSKDFRRGDNMRRHVKTHVDFKDDETIDNRENPEIIAEDNASDKADDD